MDRPNANKQANVTIQGNVNGQVAIGSNISQTQAVKNVNAGISEADLDALNDLIKSLKEQVSASVSTDQQEKALEKVSELKDAITAEKPDLTTMEYVRNWFVKNVPQLAGAVTGLVVNPIVGKLVEAAGEAITHDFKNRFGLN